MDKFPQRIKQLRKEKRMTQEELGKKLGMTKTGISYWESNKTSPPIDSLYKLCDIFNVSMDYIVGFTDDRYSDDHSSYPLEATEIFNIFERNYKNTLNSLNLDEKKIFLSFLNNGTKLFEKDNIDYYKDINTIAENLVSIFNDVVFSSDVYYTRDKYGVITSKDKDYTPTIKEKIKLNNLYLDEINKILKNIIEKNLENAIDKNND